MGLGGAEPIKPRSPQTTGTTEAPRCWQFANPAAAVLGAPLSCSAEAKSGDWCAGPPRKERVSWMFLGHGLLWEINIQTI